MRKNVFVADSAKENVTQLSRLDLQSALRCILEDSLVDIIIRWLGYQGFKLTLLYMPFIQILTVLWSP